MMWTDLLEYSRTALIVAYAVVLAMGVVLIANPKALEKANRVSNRWVKIDHYIFSRYPKWFGVFFVVVSVFSIALLTNLL
jgi:hypothetical protein